MDDYSATIPPAYDIAIIGAGAAGLAAAIFAAQRALENFEKNETPPPRIVLIDGAKKPGAKILVSGGGRCNVTNREVKPDDYNGGSKNIIRNVFRLFSEKETLAWMESLGVALKLEPTGKYFPESDSARAVLSALMNRIIELGIQTKFGFRVRDISPVKSPNSPAQNSAQKDQSVTAWQIFSATDNSVLIARKLIIATGGKALPKSGSDGAAYPWLERLGHTIIPPVPALAPLVLDDRGVSGSPLSQHFAELSGITVNATLGYQSNGYAGSTLFTHFGLSGPTAMNLSRHIARHRLDNPANSKLFMTMSIQAGGLGNYSYDKWLLMAIEKWPKAGITACLSRLFPERIATYFASTVTATRMSDLNKEERQILGKNMAGCFLSIKGDRGFSFAEATAGGVALDEVSWKSMRSRKAENLYLCGEVLDVDGRIGGFNFQWAWSTGYIAGRAAVD